MSLACFNSDRLYSEKRPKTEPFDPEDVFSESESESEDGSDDEDQIQSPQSDQNQPATKSDDVSDAVDALLAFKSLKPDIPEVKQVRNKILVMCHLLGTLGDSRNKAHFTNSRTRGASCLSSAKRASILRYVAIAI